MRAEVFLDQYATESLKVMARRRGWREAGASGKKKLIAFLGDRLFSREANRRLVQSLPRRQQHLLAALKSRGSEAEVVTLAAAVDGEEREVAADIRELVELGLFLYPRDGGRRKYRLGECGQVWMDRTVADAVEPVAALGPRPKLLAEEPAVVSEPLPGLLLADLLLVLDHLERHEVPPPADGIHEARAWRGLERRLLLPTTAAAGNEGASPRLAFLALLLEEMGLVKVREGRLVPAARAAEEFHGDRSGLHQSAFTGWLESRGWNEFERIPELVPRPVPDEARGTHTPSRGRVLRARSKVLSALRRFDPERWYAFSSLLRELKARAPGFLVRRDAAAGPGRTYRGFGQRGRGEAALPLDLHDDWDRVEGRFVARILLEPLHWLGLVRLGFDSVRHDDPSRLDAFCLTPEGAFLLGLSAAYPDPGEGSSALLAQPDFTVLCLHPSPDPGLLHDLSRFGDFAGGDRVVRFELSRSSVQRGLHQGWSAGRIGDLLAAASGSPPPQNVLASLREWEAAFRRFRVVTGATLLEDPHGLLGGGGAADALGPRLGTQLAPGIYRLRGAGDEKLRAALRRRRVAVRRLDYGGGPGQVLELGPGDSIRCSARGDDWVTRSILERVARPAGDDPGAWRLDRKALRSTLDDGLPVEEILRDLEARSRVPSPGLRLTLSAWARADESTSLAQVTLFTCSDPELRQMILAVPELTAELDEQISDDTFTIREGRHGALSKALRRHGVSLRRGGPLRPAMPRAGASRRSRAEALPFRWSRDESAGGLADSARADAQLRFLLLRAIQARRKIRVEVLEGSGSRTRELAPARLNGSFLSATCLVSGGERTMALAAIRGVELLAERFAG